MDNHNPPAPPRRSADHLCYLHVRGARHLQETENTFTYPSTSFWELPEGTEVRSLYVPGGTVPYI